MSSNWNGRVFGKVLCGFCFSLVWSCVELLVVVVFRVPTFFFPSSDRPLYVDPRNPQVDEVVNKAWQQNMHDIRASLNELATHLRGDATDAGIQLLYSLYLPHDAKILPTNALPRNQQFFVSEHVYKLRA